MRLISTLPLFIAAAPFAVGAISIAVNATVDSNIASVTVKAGSQAMTIAANGSATWTGWTVGADYTPTFTGVSDGYTGKWKVTANGVPELSGGASDAITLSQSYAGCTLSFYGEPNTYRVKFERQGGSGDFFVDAAYNVAMPSITPPTRRGYDFGGYYSEANGGGTQYYNADGTSAHVWDVAAEGTLYAKWTASANGVVLDRRLGVGGTRSVVATYGAAMPAITPPTRTGYEFDSYTAEPDGGTKYYNADGSSAHEWNKTEPTTLYARWTAIKSTVELDPQKGGGGTSSVSPSYGFPMPSADMPTHVGWTFKGFTSQPDGTGVRYYNAKGASARKWDCTSNTTLYAQWAVNEYAVTLSPQGGIGGDPSVTATYDAAMPSITPPTRSGYEFCSYTNSTGTSYYNSDGTSAAKWNLTSDTPLYAQWSPIQYTISFAVNAADATGDMDPMACTYDVPTNLTPCAFQRTGYGFAGWTNSAGTAFADGALVSNLTETADAEIPLVACWTGITYKVTLDARDPHGRGDGVLTTNEVGGAVSVATVDVTVGEPWDLPTDPNTFTNKTPTLTFVGWTYTNSENVVTNLDLPSIVPPPSAGTTNLIAKWSNPLADALDAPTLQFETFGKAGDGLDWEEYPASWSVRKDFEYSGTNVVQSVGLPASGDKDFYVAWLTTELTVTGTLTLQCKCDAPDKDGEHGTAFYFVPNGMWSSDKNKPFKEGESYMIPVEGRLGWYQVEYAKTSADTQTFAWAFALEFCTNGGGTGYVDRVTWTPE